jgi:hypothetical protein
MSDINDEQLKKLFKSQQYQQPTDLDLMRWKKSLINMSNYSNKARSIQWLQLLTAGIIGFVIGVVVLKTQDLQTPEKNLSANATIEHVHVNLD